LKNFNRMLFILFALLLAFPTPIQGQSSSCSQIVSVLSTYYNNKTGNFDLNTFTLWWQSGNALYSTIDYMLRSKDTQYSYMINTSYTLSGTPAGNFISGSFDDDAWWALAWMKAYDFTKDSRYVAVAEKVFTELSNSWDNVCNGGVWWSLEKTYKNAITNELFLAVAIRLYERTNNSSYLDWAKKEWSWFEASGMINSQNLVNDGLNRNNQTGVCTNNGQTTWTYNQGVILTGLVDLASITKNNTLITIAERIGNATITHLTHNGILQEPCEPNKNCDNDQLIFKGIFMRNLYDLTLVSGVTSNFKTFIQTNGNSVWSVDRDSKNDIGLYWYGPFDTANAPRQASGLDLWNSICYA